MTRALQRRIHRVRSLGPGGYGTKKKDIPPIWNGTLGTHFQIPAFQHPVGDPYEGTATETTLCFLETLNEYSLLKELFASTTRGGKGFCIPERVRFPIKVRDGIIEIYQNLLPWEFCRRDLVIHFASEMVYELMLTEDERRLVFSCEPFISGIAPAVAADHIRRVFKDCFKAVVVSHGEATPRNYSEQAQFELILSLLQPDFLQRHADVVRDFEPGDALV